MQDCFVGSTPNVFCFAEGALFNTLYENYISPYYASHLYDSFPVARPPHPVRSNDMIQYSYDGSRSTTLTTTNTFIWLAMIRI